MTYAANATLCKAHGNPLLDGGKVINYTSTE